MKKNFADFWSTNKKVTGVHVDPPKINTEHECRLTQLQLLLGHVTLLRAEF